MSSFDSKAVPMLCVFICAATASAAPLAFDVRTDRADSLYVPGETAEFNVTCRGVDGAPATSGVVVATIFTGTWTLDFTGNDGVKFQYSAAKSSARARGVPYVE